VFKLGLGSPSESNRIEDCESTDSQYCESTIKPGLVDDTKVGEVNSLTFPFEFELLEWVCRFKLCDCWFNITLVEELGQSVFLNSVSSLDCFLF